MPAEGPLRDRNGPGFELIETLRREPETGFLRLDRHMARLAASACELGFSCDTDKAVQALENAAAGATTALRMRLLLSHDGTVTATAQPFQPLPEGTVWLLGLARARLASNDPLLRHKTTRRTLYESARAEYPLSEVDEVLLMNEHDEVCEGTITSLFADFGEGVLVTPRLRCGLLAGVLRGALIDQGRAVEGVIPASSLPSASALYVGNALRGLIPATFLP
ncbi:4-amino-4-deoxychorismate lyase [Aquamicrobium lusatiense]|uniref:Probable branched-chain-amino-acid aminotransferase n=1 Tax=Aquamicrobium lusatiense TaxID=89772 RepID=A0A7W9VW24_9HYPH|nr:aminotransferase class IV family protein [Aquamicrobium lusatiense]MBB6013638.1 4-amino-4-deoxychorismate lyase [Aquamicrobium lusatiense]